MTTMFELDNPQEHAIFNIYLELIDTWMDVMENLIPKEKGCERIDAIINKMNKSLETFPHERFMLKYFFINGEGWKNYHPIDAGNMTKEQKQKIIGIRTGESRFYNPDLEYLGLNLKEGPADEVLQEVLDKTKKYKHVTAEELKNDYTNIQEMEKNLEEMEKILENEKESLSKEEEIMNELLQNEEVKKIYQNIKEGKTMNNVNETKVEDIKKETEEKVEEEIKQEDTKKEKGLGLISKVAISVSVVTVIGVVGYVLKERFFNK